MKELDGIPYDQLFVFELLGHNFEPSEVAAAFGLVQLAGELTTSPRAAAYNAAAHRA